MPKFFIIRRYTTRKIDIYTSFTRADIIPARLRLTDLVLELLLCSGVDSADRQPVTLGNTVSIYFKLEVSQNGQ